MNDVCQGGILILLIYLSPYFKLVTVKLDIWLFLLNIDLYKYNYNEYSLIFPIVQKQAYFFILIKLIINFR